MVQLQIDKNWFVYQL